MNAESGSPYDKPASCSSLSPSETPSWESIEHSIDQKPQNEILLPGMEMECRRRPRPKDRGEKFNDKWCG